MIRIIGEKNLERVITQLQTENSETFLYYGETSLNANEFAGAVTRVKKEDCSVIDFISERSGKSVETMIVYTEEKDETDLRNLESGIAYLENAGFVQQGILISHPVNIEQKKMIGIEVIKVEEESEKHPRGLRANHGMID